MRQTKYEAVPRGTEPSVALVSAREQAVSQMPHEGDNQLSLAVPRRGHVLSTIVEMYGQPIREAVEILGKSLARKPCADIRAALLAPTTGRGRSDAEMSAWALVSMWVTGIASGALSVSASLADAERWFLGDGTAGLSSLPPAQIMKRTESVLRAEADAPAYLDLLPYILDPHGPGSRLSVMRDPSTRSARTRKRADGVFYTPADVAEYMAGECIDELAGSGPATIFDPACGTGVYLRAALKLLRRRFPDQDALSLGRDFLFGADIDPWPLDAAAFVLVADIWESASQKAITPAQCWRLMRENLVCVDTLLIDPAEALGGRQPSSGNANKHAVSPELDSGRNPISQLFPRLVDGPTVILGNPPYADLGHRDDLDSLGDAFRTIAAKPKASAEVYLAFVEQMIKLARARSCAGALVLPLSIACNIGPQFATVRKLILQAAGEWRFAFFDREPHALFGEDVKTRNAIVLWSRHASDSRTRLATGPLRKWRGDTRAAMFKNLGFTPIGVDICAGIPKVEGQRQAAALEALSARGSKLEQAVQKIERRSLKGAPNADNRTIFIGPTAYNFLNVFLRPQRGLLHGGVELSEHPLYALRCASEEDALSIFAILSSHLSYWWWHAHGDGFHVTRRFLGDLPFGAEILAGSAGRQLAACGAELWSAIQARPIMSLNRGRTSLAYSPNGHDDIRRKADEVLAQIAGLDRAFVDELQKFTARSVSATLHENAIAETADQEGA